MDPDPGGPETYGSESATTYETCAEREGLDELDLCGEDAAVNFPLLLLSAQAVAEASQQGAGARRPQAGHHARQGAGAGGQDCRVKGGGDRQRRPAARRRPGWTKPQATANECCHFHFLKYGL